MNDASLRPPSAKHVLIVTSGPLCRNPRSLKEAVTLAAAGFRVTALTVFFSQVHAEMDRHLLAETGVNQVMLHPGTSVAARFVQRLLGWMARKLVARFNWPLPRALGPVSSLLHQVSNIPADLTIVHNEAPFWVGCQLLPGGRKIAADFEDWYSEDLLPEAQRHRPLQLLRRLEGALLHQAVFCTTTSHGLAQALAATYGAEPPLVMPNCFALQPAPPARPQRAPELVWFSQTIGPGRGLEEFLGHWGQLPPNCGRITIIGAMAGGFADRLLAQVPASSCDRVTFLPPVAPDELPALLARYDVGLALEPRSPRNKDLTISNKILQYLNAGLAIIATSTAGQIEVIKNAPDAGIVIDLDSTAVRGALERLLSDHPRLVRAQAASRAAAEQHYHWEQYAPTLVGLVNQATGSPS